jgi:ribosomal protein S18 acetylase RimI-like enzyme
VNESFAIRSATVADATIIASQRRAMFQDMRIANQDQLMEMEARFTDWVKPRIERGEYKGWLVTDESGEIIAGAGLWLIDTPPHAVDPYGRRGNILNVYTHPSFRRQGLARRLMNIILDWCRENQIGNLSLQASNDGRALYESLGFKSTNEMRLRL